MQGGLTSESDLGSSVTDALFGGFGGIMTKTHLSNRSRKMKTEAVAFGPRRQVYSNKPTAGLWRWVIN